MEDLRSRELAKGTAAMARSVLHTVASLAPSSEQAKVPGSIPLDWFRWLPYGDARVMAYRLHLANLSGLQKRLATMDPPEIVIDRDLAERLGAVDQVRIHDALQLGWLFVAGPTVDENGTVRRMFLPLVTAPVRASRPRIGRGRLQLVGDVEVTARLSSDDRERFEQQLGDVIPPFPVDGPIYEPTETLTEQELHRSPASRFARDVARAAGYDRANVVLPVGNPEHFRDGDELVVVAGLAVYATKEAGESSRAASLRQWAERPLARWTAFHAVYLGTPGPEEPPSHEPVESPFVLTPAQRSAVRASRTRPVTVISGAPGTGKSHTICAVALDALAHGRSVLVGAKTDAAVDALIDLFEQAPGPEPIVFGSNERRDALADRLSGGQLAAEDSSAVVVAIDRLEHARADRQRIRSTIAERLDAEITLDDASAAAVLARVRAPGLFAPTVDLDVVAELVDDADGTDEGWFRRRRARKALARLDATLGGSRPFAPDELRPLLDLAVAQRTADAAARVGADEIDAQWQALVAADKEVRRRVAKWLDADCRSPHRLSHGSLAAIGALATALRSGREARRQQLARLDDERLTRALPLWVGSLPDIDDLLPCTPALFDLVILDEASFIDQPLAVPALLRGERAVVVGDPHQLRHVSFLSNQQITDAVAASQITSPGLVAKLDVRRNGAFDIAAASAPVITLDEHFRSDPHLVDFVAHRIYGDRITVATRNPETEGVDCIDVEHVDGHRDDEGVVRAEIEEVVKKLRRLQQTSHHSVGVITPFRAQADALEEAVLAAFDADELASMDLRVGTVHAFQGNERDVVIASLGIDADCTASTWRFAEDPHLFTVMVTRARKRFVVMCSAEPPTGGLLADYLALADRPPGRPRSAGELGDWAERIAADLDAAGRPALPAYPCGRHVIDVCVGDLNAYFALSCGVHPDGPDSHIERELSLRRAGWPMREAFRSQWEDRIGELVIDLADG